MLPFVPNDSIWVDMQCSELSLALGVLVVLVDQEVRQLLLIPQVQVVHAVLPPLVSLVVQLDLGPRGVQLDLWLEGVEVGVVVESKDMAWRMD